MGAHPLFLKSCSRPTWLSFVREHFPALIGEYERFYAKADFAGTDYRNAMAARVRQICRKHHLGERSTDALLTRVTNRDRYTETKKPPITALPAEPAQTRLFA